MDAYAVSMAVMKGERSGEHEEKGRRNDMAGRCCNGAGGLATMAEPVDMASFAFFLKAS